MVVLLLFDAGFGSVATVPWLLFSFFHSEALMAMAFPLFALAACVSDPLAHYTQGGPLSFCSSQLDAGHVTMYCHIAPLPVLCFVCRARTLALMANISGPVAGIQMCFVLIST